ncbi:MAG: hypothetical protein BGP14_06735 [Sphingobacteriales bacterium 44-15]|nr:MAG: hypothetical protein BGP14_06735 [Sphingobacteriales bacterium 44-15]
MRQPLFITFYSSAYTGQRLLPRRARYLAVRFSLLPFDRIISRKRWLFAFRETAIYSLFFCNAAFSNASASFCNTA